MCYVCHEPCSVRSQCLCAAHVHELCLLNSAIACRTDRCTICKGTIANLKLLRMCQRTRVEEEQRANDCELVLLIVAALLFSTLSLLFFAASTEQLEHYAHLYALCCAASMSLAGSASRAFCRRAEPLTLRSVSTLAVLL